MSAPIELFVCEPLQAKLTRFGCVARYKRAAREAEKNGRSGDMHLGDGATCLRCPVGAAHVRGETPTHWPVVDGAEPAPIAIVATSIPSPSPRSEERSEPASVRPPTAGRDRCAPRAAEPAASPKRAEARVDASSVAGEAERVEGVPAAKPGARAAERIAAERPGPTPIEGVRPESSAAGGAGRASFITRADRVCEHCSRPYVPTGQRQRWCAECAPVARRNYRHRYNTSRSKARAEARANRPHLRVVVYIGDVAVREVALDHETLEALLSTPAAGAAS